jgi:hypothetical protein
MLDPLDVITFCLQASRGAYALLLGSGLSTSAGIPTGWEIVQDLLRRLAAARHEDCGSNPEDWFTRTFGHPPTYSSLLAELAPSKAERQALLRGYFEPTAEDRECGRKVPTAAHREIASLVSADHFRVILTTNFDRLIEQSLESEGLAPVVVSAPDAIPGLLLHQLPVLVVKLHGDYLDTRLKNTPEELASYDFRLRKLLARVFDEYGLLVAGWSARWDTALRHALARAGLQRLSVFWLARGPMGSEAQQLIALKKARLVQISSADSFFHQLSQKLHALDEYDQPHPISKAISVQMLKKYLLEPRFRIAREDLVRETSERAYRAISEADLPLSTTPTTGAALLDRMRRYELLVDTIQAMMIVGCYWTDREDGDLWVRVVERFANPAETQDSTYFLTWYNLRRYPALVLLYSGGIAATAADRLPHLRALLEEPRVHPRGEAERPLLASVEPWRVIDPPQLEQGLRRRSLAPASEHLFSTLRTACREILPSEERYEASFDRFELILALAAVRALPESEWLPLGRFARLLRFDKSFDQLLDHVLRKSGHEPSVISLFFGGDKQSYQTAIERLRYNVQVLLRQSW